MFQIATTYLVMLITYIAIDFLWITFFMHPFFSANLSHLIKDAIPTKFLLLTGGLFFIFYVGGLFWFGARSGIIANSFMIACFSGAFLGFLAYGTYGLTNYIFLKNYPLLITILDISWGTLLGGMVSTLGFFCFRFLAGQGNI